MENYIFYKRKSSDSEDKQILSLESQNRTIRESIPNFHSFNIVSDFEESKSAKAPGRPKFNEMCSLLEQGKAKYIICWQLNRLARNSVDGGRIIWLVQNYGVQIITPTKIYDANDILLMYVEFAMSNQFVNDLRKTTIRGLNDKLQNGIAPILAPIGYINDTTKKQGLRDILPDEERFVLVRKMWDLLLTGNYTPPKILDIATNEWGLRHRNGKPISRSKIYELFRNIFYTGKYFEYGGKLYENGIHKPMITIDEYEKAQKILGSKGKQKMRLSSHGFAFNSSLIKCGCGSGITAHERYRKVCPSCHLKYNSAKNVFCPKCSAPAPEKTTYYCYYHCTKKKNRNCKELFMKKDDLEAEFENLITNLTLPEEFVHWALDKLRKAHEEESSNRGSIQVSVQASLNAVSKKLDILLSKFLSEANEKGEIISDEEYKFQKEKLQEEKVKLEESLTNYSNKQDNWLQTAEKAFDFALTAKEKFKTATKEEKREMVTTFGLNFILISRKLHLDYLKPFGKVKEASERLQDPTNKITPVKEIVAKGQKFYFDSCSPLWGD